MAKLFEWRLRVGPHRPLFPDTLKSNLAGVARRSEIIFFSLFHHSVFPAYFFMYPFLFNTFFFLQFTLSLSLRIFWSITLSSLSSTLPFFFCLGSQRISRFKCTAVCTLYSVKYSQFFLFPPLHPNYQWPTCVINCSVYDHFTFVLLNPPTWQTVYLTMKLAFLCYYC